MVHTEPSQIPQIIDVDTFEEPEVQFLGAYRWRIRSNPQNPFVVSDSEEEDIPHSMSMHRQGGQEPTPSRSSRQREYGSSLSSQQRRPSSSKHPTSMAPQRGEVADDSADEFLNIEAEGEWLPLARDYVVPHNAAADDTSLKREGDIAIHSAKVSRKQRQLSNGIDDGRVNEVWKKVQQYPEFLWVGFQPPPILSHNKKHGSVFTPLASLRSESIVVKAPSCINRIVQSGDLLAVASNTPGGGEAESEDDHTYNTGGALKVVSGEHSVRYSSVNSVVFDPTRSSTLVSGGCDKTMRFWNCENAARGEIPRMTHIDNLSYVPLDLELNFDGSLLAVSGNKGYIHIYLQEKQIQGFQIAQNASVSRILWGKGPSSHLLFASALSKQQSGVGFHKVYDITKQKSVFTLGTRLAGEAMSFQAHSNLLALVTYNHSMDHLLQLYNIKQSLQPVTHLQLRPHFIKDRNIRINDIAFSPDGIYLALGRRDNQVHIYDSRYLTEEPLLVLSHKESISSTKDFERGITKIEWVQSPNNHSGLVTGGADGYVNLWDISLGQFQNPQILAEMDANVSYFSLGTQSKGEIPLVV